MRKQEAGFTLVETVLMLLVISLITVIPVLSVDKMIESAEIELFFQELSSNITLMQNHAILNNEATKVHFIQQNDREFIDFQVVQKTNHPLNKRMLVDSPYYHFRGKGSKDFYFSKGTGNISGSSSFSFWTTKGDYRFTYWLGSGRFEIKKISSR